LPPLDELYVYVFDEGEARGLLAQLETSAGPRPFTELGLELCASDDAEVSDLAGINTLLAGCDRGTASASHGWAPRDGTGNIASGVWRDGYPVCPGVFDPEARWVWWFGGGTASPLDSDPASSTLIARIPVVAL
jgi:hypothetical protein